MYQIVRANDASRPLLPYNLYFVPSGVELFC